MILEENDKVIFSHRNCSEVFSEYFQIVRPIYLEPGETMVVVIKRHGNPNYHNLNMDSI